MGHTRGEPNEDKKNTHPECTTALSRWQALKGAGALSDKAVWRGTSLSPSRPSGCNLRAANSNVMFNDPPQKAGGKQTAAR